MSNKNTKYALRVLAQRAFSLGIHAWSNMIYKELEATEVKWKAEPQSG